MSQSSSFYSIIEEGKNKFLKKLFLVFYIGNIIDLTTSRGIELYPVWN